ncbi:MAG: ribosome silencing factor [Roseimicrobium sp.]
MAKKAASKKVAQPVAAPSKFEGETMARAAANYADDKKAEDIVIMDVRGISPVTDYFVICSVTSMPQLRAVRDEVEYQFKTEHKARPLAGDRNLESLWLILHYGDVMVHIFHKEKRDFYSLEDLWSDAPMVDWSPTRPAAAAAPAVKKAPARKAVKKAAVKKAPSKKAASKKGK